MRRVDLHRNTLMFLSTPQHVSEKMHCGCDFDISMIDSARKFLDYFVLVRIANCLAFKSKFVKFVPKYSLFFLWI